MSLTSLGYDACSFKQSLNDTLAPGMYVLGTPLPMREDCDGPRGLRTDASSELMGLKRRETKCAEKLYGGEGAGGLHCEPPGPVASRLRHLRAEDTRVSNPPSTMRGSGMNRWTPLCEQPQDHALKPFEHIPYNDRRRAKDMFTSASGARGVSPTSAGATGGLNSASALTGARGLVPLAPELILPPPAANKGPTIAERVSEFPPVPMLPEYLEPCKIGPIRALRGW
jgi:hypothetical protein